jgi:hypothetical protein
MTWEGGVSDGNGMLLETFEPSQSRVGYFSLLYILHGCLLTIQ